MFAVPSGTMPLRMPPPCAAAITPAPLPSPPATSPRWNARRASAAPIDSTFKPAAVSSTIASQPSSPASSSRRLPKSLPVRCSAGLTTKRARRRSPAWCESTQLAGGSTGHPVMGIVDMRMAFRLDAEDIPRPADQAFELNRRVLDHELVGQHLADFGEDVLRLCDPLVIEQQMRTHRPAPAAQRPATEVLQGASRPSPLHRGDHRIGS